MPASAHAGALVGVGNHPTGDVERAIEVLSWGEDYRIDEGRSLEAAWLADEIGPKGPYFDGVTAPVAAVGRTVNAPVVSADCGLTHEEMKQIIDVDEYRA